MPCRYDPTPAELEASRQATIEKQIKPWRDKLDVLTHENDMYRETLLNMVTVLGTDAENLVPKALLKKIEKDQVAHRKEDLDRLEKTFLSQAQKVRNSTEAVTVLRRLEKVQDADPKKPLEPQLGFDPDEY